MPAKAEVCAAADGQRADVHTAARMRCVGVDCPVLKRARPGQDRTGGSWSVCGGAQPGAEGSLWGETVRQTDGEAGKFAKKKRKWHFFKKMGLKTTVVGLLGDKKFVEELKMFLKIA